MSHFFNRFQQLLARSQQQQLSHQKKPTWKSCLCVNNTTQTPKPKLKKTHHKTVRQLAHTKLIQQLKKFSKNSIPKTKSTKFHRRKEVYGSITRTRQLKVDKKATETKNDKRYIANIS
jgi:hypothetical protein